MASELTDYARQELAAGTSPELLRSKLKAQGWDDWTINTTLADAQRSEAAAAPETVAPPPAAPTAEATPVAAEVVPVAAETAPAGPAAAPSLVPDHTQLKRHRMLSAVILAIAVVILAGGSAWGYYAYFPSPERVLEKMFVRMADVRSFRYAASAEVESDKNPLVAGKAKVGLEGFSDLTDPAKPKSQTIFSVDHEQFPFRLEVVVVGKVFYFRLAKAPEMFRQFENQWVRADANQIAEQMGAQAKGTDGSEIEPEKVEKIRDLVRRSRFVKVVEDLGAAEVEGVKTYHFRFELDQEGILDFMTELVEISGEKALSEKEVENLQDALEILPSGELWVGRGDFLLRKVRLIWEQTGEKVSFETVLSDFGKTFDWSEPPNALSIQEMMMRFMGPGVPGAFPTAPPLPAD